MGSAYDTSIVAGGTNYYQFTTGSEASTHTISLTNTNSDLSWDLYADAASIGTSFSCDESIVAADEICQTSTLDAGTTYYIYILEWDDVAGSFTIKVSTP